MRGAALLAILFATAGCKTTGNAAQVKDDDSGSGGAAPPASLQLTVGQADDGSISLSDDQAPYTCETPVVAASRQRLVCHRDQVQLDLILDSQSPSLAVFYPQGYTQAKSYLKCPAFNGPGALACTAAPLDAEVNGRLVSPFPSTVDAFNLHNAHVVQADDSGRGLVVRGMAPISAADFDLLKSYGIKAVLMFKDPEPHMNPSDIQAETQKLVAAGYDQSLIMNIPFPWKNYTGFALACQQTVQALQFLKANATNGNPVFFHCTVGEDRTGYLAALYRMLRENLSTQDAFSHEMCEHGYSGGNPNKPYANVINAIDTGLTPIFFKMASKVASGALSWDRLDPATCNDEPAIDASGELCETSVLYKPDAAF